MKNDGFDSVAPFYEKLSRLVFGNTLFQAQLTFINDIPDSAAVLIIGGGNGAFLKKLLETKPRLIITYVEASKKMLVLSQKIVGENPNVQWIHGTQNDVPDKGYEIIITHFLLDLFSEGSLNELIPQLKHVLNKNGSWLITDFRQSPSSKLPSRILLWLMYRFFRITCNIEASVLPEIWRVLKENNLKLEKAQGYYFNMVYSTLMKKEDEL